ncbi:hypothetical protein NFI96_024824, partial [Prochilodus magdalenae]
MPVWIANIIVHHLLRVIISWREGEKQEKPRRPHGHHRKRNTSNLIYAPRSSATLTRVVGGLWNCQSAVQKADFISALASHHSLHFLALTETWITHENSSTPAALSSAFNFSHSPRQTGRGGGTGNFIDELDTLLSLFPADGSPLLLLGDFNLPSDKLQSSCLQPLLSSFDLTLNPSPPTHRGGNTLDLLFLSISPLHIPPSLGITCTPSTRSSPPAPWLSDVLRNNRRELRRAERKWRRSQLDSDLHTYQAVLSRFSAEVTTAKSSFYKRKLEESASDPRKLFSIFSSLLNPPSPPPSSSLTLEDFVTFFEEKVNKIRQSFSPVPAPPSISPHPLATNSLTCFASLSSDEILQLLESSNPTTCPLDPIPSPLLRSISLDLLPFISSLINSSLSSGTGFRTSTSLASNPPIPQKSATLSSVLILLDLSAAFDTVNHKTLLSVLTVLGITGTAWKWFESYLEDRHYQVCNRISACLTDISSWMTAHHLKLNPSKTELLSPPTEDARSLGVVLDGQLSFSAHIANLTRSCRFLLYNIRRIRPFLSQEATQLLVQSLVISRLEVSVLAPRWWNELPLGVRTAESLAVFKRRLKTHLFVKHFSTSTEPLFGQCLSSWWVLGSKLPTSWNIIQQNTAR